MNGLLSKPMGTSFSPCSPYAKHVSLLFFLFSIFFLVSLFLKHNSPFNPTLHFQAGSHPDSQLPHSSPSTSFIQLNQPFSTQLNNKKKALRISQGNIKSVSEWICLPFWNQNTKAVILCTNLCTILPFVFSKKIELPAMLSNFSGHQEEILLQQSYSLNTGLL